MLEFDPNGALRNKHFFELNSELIKSTNSSANWSKNKTANQIGIFSQKES
jgi:hypothetical protein